MAIEHPYLLFLGDAPDQLAAKTAQGIAHWRPEWCLGQYRLAGCNADLGLTEMTLTQAVEAGSVAKARKCDDLQLLVSVPCGSP